MALLAGARTARDPRADLAQHCAFGAGPQMLRSYARDLGTPAARLRRRELLHDRGDGAAAFPAFLAAPPAR